MPNFDDVLQEIGDFGRFQIVNFILLCLPIFLTGTNSLTYVFQTGIPNYRCFVEGCDSETNPEYEESWVSAAIPSSSDDGPYVPNQCFQFLLRINSSLGLCLEEDFEAKTIKCNRWVYEGHERTIVGDFNITCSENQWKLALVQTALFLGLLIGAPISAVLADIFGRKVILVLCMTIMSLTGIAEAMSKNYLVFQFLVFFNAFVAVGVYSSAYILAVELVGSQKREMVTVIIFSVYIFGEITTGLLAWLFKDWVVTQHVISIPAIIGVAYYWMVPQSVRWLLTNNKKLQAGAIVRKAAAVNGVVLPVELLALVEEPNSVLADTVLPNHEPGVWVSVKQLFHSWVLSVRLLLLCFIWMANVFVYYGTPTISTKLGGNKYLNFILVSIVGIPGNTLSWWTMKKLGRRWSIFGFRLLCGVAFAVAALVPEGTTWAVVLLFTIGKLSVAASHGITYTYTAELHPTVIRSVAVSICYTAGRLGGIVAAFVPMLGQYSKPLPFILFSVVSLLSSVLVWWLPETRGMKLPDSVAEASALK